jgi:hypothetical protein
MRFFNVPGTTGVTIPEGAKPVGIAGETGWLIIENGQASLWFKLGAAAGTALARSKYRRDSKPVREKIVANRRGTAALVMLTLTEGQSFEACGYARIAPWKRYVFDGKTIVCEAL